MKSPKSRHRFAFTLVELLIALTIASVLTAIALPTLKDSMRQNSLSRAASLVKGAFINARSQAIRTGRPFGIVLERRRATVGSGTPDGLDFTGANYCTRMYYVQSPLEYRGDYDGAVGFPVFEDANTGSAVDPLVPRIFVPQSSAGLLFAASGTNLNSTAAANLISLTTRFGIGGSDYSFEITGLEQVTLGTTITNLGANRVLVHPGLTAGEPGVLVSFNYLDFSPRYSGVAGIFARAAGGDVNSMTVAASNSRFPAGLPSFQALPFKFRSNPIKAPLAPVNMIGKTVVDLSISGTVFNPSAFNAQDIIDATPGTAPLPLDVDLSLGDVIVMFAADGSLDGILYSQRVVAGGIITGFTFLRVDPASTVSFNVGFVDGLVDNLDDMARFPVDVPGTDYQVHPGDASLADPGPTAALEVDKAPNFANTDCAWIHIQPLSGHISLETVASQPPLSNLSVYYGYGTAPGSQFARDVVRDRLRQSRRLATAGAVQ